MSVWQLVDALERNRIVPIFVIQFEFCPGGTCPETQPVRNLYEGLSSLPMKSIQAQTFFFDANQETITQALINVIQEAYNVSINQVTMHIHVYIHRTSESFAGEKIMRFVCI